MRDVDTHQCVKVKVKVKFTLEQATKAQRGRRGIALKVKCSRYRSGVSQRVGRGIALLFHDRGARRG